MSFREVRCNPSVSDDDFGEGDPDGLQSPESKWRSSLRKKFSRLGKKKRPMSWNFDAIRSANRDDLVGLSSQSLFPPYCGASSPDGMAIPRPSKRQGSLMSSKLPLREGEESSGKGFLRKMFSTKKSNTGSEVPDSRTSGNFEYNNPYNVNDLLDTSYLSKRTKRDGMEPSQIKNRLRKFVSRGSLTSSFASFSTKFRERLAPPPTSIGCRLNQNIFIASETADKDNFEENNVVSFRSKSRSISEPRLSRSSSNRKRFSEFEYSLESPFGNVCDSRAAFSQDLDTIRFIDSSSEEDIQGSRERMSSNGGLGKSDSLSKSHHMVSSPRIRAELCSPVRQVSSLKELGRNSNERFICYSNYRPPDDTIPNNDEVKSLSIPSTGSVDCLGISETSTVEVPVSSLQTLFEEVSDSEGIKTEDMELISSSRLKCHGFLYSSLYSISDAKQTSVESLYERKLDRTLEKLDSQKSLSQEAYPLGRVLESNHYVPTSASDMHKGIKYTVCYPNISEVDIAAFSSQEGLTFGYGGDLKQGVLSDRRFSCLNTFNEGSFCDFHSVLNPYIPHEIYLQQDIFQLRCQNFCYADFYQLSNGYNHRLSQELFPRYSEVIYFSNVDWQKLIYISPDLISIIIQNYILSDSKSFDLISVKQSKFIRVYDINQKNCVNFSALIKFIKYLCHWNNEKPNAVSKLRMNNQKSFEMLKLEESSKLCDINNISEFNKLKTLNRTLLSVSEKDLLKNIKLSKFTSNVSTDDINLYDKPSTKSRCFNDDMMLTDKFRTKYNFKYSTNSEINKWFADLKRNMASILNKTVFLENNKIENSLSTNKTENGTKKIIEGETKKEENVISAEKKKSNRKRRKRKHKFRRSIPLKNDEPDKSLCFSSQVESSSVSCETQNVQSKVFSNRQQARNVNLESSRRSSTGSLPSQGIQACPKHDSLAVTHSFDQFNRPRVEGKRSKRRSYPERRVVSYAQESEDFIDFETCVEDIKPFQTLEFYDSSSRYEENLSTSGDGVDGTCVVSTPGGETVQNGEERFDTKVPFASEYDFVCRNCNVNVFTSYQSYNRQMCDMCSVLRERQSLLWQYKLFNSEWKHKVRRRKSDPALPHEHAGTQPDSKALPQPHSHYLNCQFGACGKYSCDACVKSFACKMGVPKKRNPERCSASSGRDDARQSESLSLEAHNSSVQDPENKSVRWILTEGEEILASHQVPQNTLSGITKQAGRFEDFYAFAKFESEKSLSLLQEEEHFERYSETSEETQDLAKDLRRHICSFADRLHLTKDRLEDTAKCYLLLDKAYEWALEAMKVVGRVKSSGTANPEQVGAAAESIGELLQENPPVSEETFAAMLDLATRLDNQTLLHQCKMAHSRCKETISLLRSRQSALLKARRQMEFDCQSYVDLNEVLSVPEDPTLSFSPHPWSLGAQVGPSGRRRSACSLGSRSRDPLSRCSSIETDEESVVSEAPFSSTPSKAPLEGKSSLRGIKELRESEEDLRAAMGFVRGTTNLFRSSIGSDFRLCHDSSSLGSSPSTTNNIAGSTIRAFSSGSSSSCSSSDSSGPTSGDRKERRALWRFSESSRAGIEEANDCLDDSVLPLSPVSHRSSLPSEANSHLLIRGSQINLSNSEDLTQEELRKNKTLLLIMQELIQTERDYVNSLEYIIENYIPELMREDIPQALRGQRNVIFGNIEKIYEFHSGYFLKALESCRSRPFSVGSIFLRYENQFYLYALYNKNKPKSDELMADFGASFFKAMQLALGDKMDLSSYLLKPVQRMGKYALLLKQLLKECGRNEEGHEELKAAQEMVQFQLRHGNDLLAMDSLRDCDVNLKEQGRLLRQGEFLVMEGSRGKKTLRHVFLFEDLILFSKARKDPEKKNLDIFQYKQSLKTTDIGLTAQVGDSPLRFEIWFRKRKPSDTFLFQSPSPEVKEAWSEEISKLLWRQALRNRKLRLHEMSSMGIGNKPCLDIRPSEDQINDRSVCIAKAPPRLRLTTSASLTDASSLARRPHSVISVSSSSSSAESSTHSSSAAPSFVGTLNLGFESGDSPKPLQRSVTRTSQCSAESGIITDIFPEREPEESLSNHAKVERSNSTITNTSVDSALSPSSPLSHSLSSPVIQSPPLSPLQEPSSPPPKPSSPATELPSEIPPSTIEKEKTLLTTEV